MLRCADGTYYTGVTTDVARRVREHNTSPTKGAKYTKARRPVTLVYRESVADRSAAQSREFFVRHLPKAHKQRLVSILDKTLK